MRTIKCDGCGCELQETTAFGVVVGGTVNETFDLCGNCREALIDWLANRRDEHEPVETKKEEEDPLYGGPKNDKVGYSVYQLEKMLHRGRVSIRKALRLMKIDEVKWERDNKLISRCYLGEAEMAELKRILGVK